LPPQASPLIVDLSYDDHGFRNPATHSRAHVAFIGDSYIEAVQTALGSTLPQLVASSTGLTVANLGLSGYGPQQELVVLERYALPLEPKVIVWAFYEGNDLADLQRYDELRPKLGSDVPTAPDLIDRTLSKNLLDTLYMRFKSCEPSPKAQAQSGVFRDRDQRQTTLYFEGLSRPLSNAELDAFMRFASIIGRAQEQAVASGARLILLFVPTKFRVYRDLVQFPENSTGTHAELNDLPERLAALAAQLSPPLEFFNLVDPFRSAAALGELVYLADDSHWTPTGHRIAATALEDLLAQ
ncbi:MAG: GDSL-type esterase/lipase family protein, partial [Pseudomonadota bacterium]|nr:GDSL-type esterase/lipase family protein [Pseudomonadota bacterium]